jgi:hypothetical protein
MTIIFTSFSNLEIYQFSSSVTMIAHEDAVPHHHRPHRRLIRVLLHSTISQAQQHLDRCQSPSSYPTVGISCIVLFLFSSSSFYVCAMRREHVMCVVCPINVFDDSSSPYSSITALNAQPGTNASGSVSVAQFLPHGRYCFSCFFCIVFLLFCLFFPVLF